MKKKRRRKDFIRVDKITDPIERTKVITVMAIINERSRRGFWEIKRTTDIILSFMALTVLFVPMLIIAALIYKEDGGNPFFAQTRVGRRGKLFKMYKFRTMVPNADKMKKDLMEQNEMDGPVFKIKDDPRITKIGKILRKTSLDELPQFFNVLRGDMCIIGPRPPLPEEYAQYTEYQKIRLLVTPGITCDWQISPKRNTIPFDEWINMDVYYVINRDIFRDIRIMFMTAVVMIRGEGQ